MNYKQKVGRFGEELAKKYLIKNGYIILDSNVKTSYQEIDIIAKFKEKIIFFEVKTRTTETFGTADENISARKIQNLKKAINLYMEERDVDPENVRLDLIAIDIDKIKRVAKIKHYNEII